MIDERGEQLGVFNLENALQKAYEARLDLIQVTDKVEPPICKIMDYGKYAYQQSKKEKKQRHQAGEMKSIRLTFNISPHDMETRCRAAEKFLKKGQKVRVELLLRGREKALGEHAKGKIEQFLGILNGLIPIKIERELKRDFRGFATIVAKQ